jgi:hypothetical protein
VVEKNILKRAFHAFLLLHVVFTDNGVQLYTLRQLQSPSSIF